jgi:hypothetical protein
VNRFIKGRVDILSDKKTLNGILVRKVQFEFPEDFEPHGNPAKPDSFASGGSD